MRPTGIVYLVIMQRNSRVAFDITDYLGDVGAGETGNGAPPELIRLCNFCDALDDVRLACGGLITSPSSYFAFPFTSDALLDGARIPAPRLDVRIVCVRVFDDPLRKDPAEP
jgi:hypothetical protein